MWFTQAKGPRLEEHRFVFELHRSKQSLAYEDKLIQGEVSRIKRAEDPMMTLVRPKRVCSLISFFVLIAIAAPPAFCQKAVMLNQPKAPNGKEIFDERCSACHGMDGGGVAAAVNMLGPSLMAEHDKKWVQHRVREGKGRMPTFSRMLTPREIQAVSDYVTQDLAVIPLQGGNISEGGTRFREYCAPCHRTAVRGGALTFAGRNAPALTDASAAVIAGTVRWGPGPMPSFPKSIISNEQLASIVKYVKFVQHPPDPGGAPLNYYGPVAEGFVAWIFVFVLVGVGGWIERGGKG